MRSVSPPIGYPWCASASRPSLPTERVGRRPMVAKCRVTATTLSAATSPMARCPLRLRRNSAGQRERKAAPVLKVTIKVNRVSCAMDCGRLQHGRNVIASYFPKILGSDLQFCYHPERERRRIKLYEWKTVSYSW